MEATGWRIALAGIAAVALVVGLASLIVQVRALFRFLRQRVVAELPFAGTADVTFDRAGGFALGIDRPRLRGWGQPTGSVLADKATGRDRYGYALIEAGSGARIEGRKTLVPLITTTMTRIRYDVARFDVPRAGRWRLVVEGFATSDDDGIMRWRITRAGHPLGFAARIVGLIAAGALSIAGLVGTALAIAG